MSPSITAVRKMRSPQTTGEEWPRPAIGVFHLMFLVSLHSVGTPVSVEMPCPPGPRHCDQLAAGPATAFVGFGLAAVDAMANAATPSKADVKRAFFITHSFSLL